VGRCVDSVATPGGSEPQSTAVPRNPHGDSDDVLSSVLTAIDRLEELEDQLATVAPLAIERQRLLRARAELLGMPVGGQAFMRREDALEAAGLLS
jgi:hypothetical protein